jgi:hypothetical protein
VIEIKTKRKMFDKDVLDDNHEIPAPFSFERYNFNPHEIKGFFDKTEEGNIVIL